MRGLQTVDDYVDLLDELKRWLTSLSFLRMMITPRRVLDKIEELEKSFE